MFDDIIMSMIMNKALECNSEGADGYLTKIENSIIYMYRGSLQYFYWNKVTHEGLDVPCTHFNVERIKMKKYFANILKRDTSSNNMKENIDNWLDSFEKFNNKYIIMYTESYNISFIERSRYITVRSPSGFINHENETRCYINATIQLLYCKIIFRQLILNLDCYTVMYSLDRKSKQFYHHYQMIMIVEELQIFQKILTMNLEITHLEFAMN